jgi:DNA topoisomerase-3
MKLYLTEKPKTARQLCDVLGNARHVKSSESTKFGGHKQGDGWAVTWLSGHFYRLLEPHEYSQNYKEWRLSDLPIIYRDITWKQIDQSETIGADGIAEQIAHIQSLYPKVTELILATDGDQEGQVLGQVFLEQSGWKGPVKRLWTDVWEPSGLKKSLENLSDNKLFQGTYNAGITRVILDQLVGINLTRLFTLKAQQSGYSMVANTGRVRSPALAIVVDHDNMVSSHSSREYHTLRASFSYKGQAFKGKLVVPDHLLEDQSHCYDRIAIENILKDVQNETAATVINVNSQEKKNKPPKPFSQNTLAQYCNLHHGMMPDETLAACQSLYEAGYVSYPRVEVEIYETDVLNKAPEILAGVSKVGQFFKDAVARTKLSNAQPVFSDQEVDGHSAIFCTSLAPTFKDLKQQEQFVYQAIAMRFVAQFSDDFVTAQSNMMLKVNKSTFIAESNSIISLGWAALFPREDNSSEPLPSIESGSICDINEIALLSRNTKAPPRLTVDTFLSILRDCTNLLSPKIAARVGKGQLGTGATQPSILKTLESQKAIQIVDKKFVIPTKTGKNLRELLPDLIASVDLSSIWELNFRQIRAGQKSHEEFINSSLEWLSKVVEAGKNSKFPRSPTYTPCELCDCAMNRKTSTKPDGGSYWICSNEECKLIVADRAGLPIKLHPDHGKPCPKCGNPLTTRTSKNNLENIAYCTSQECRASKSGISK